MKTVKTTIVAAPGLPSKFSGGGDEFQDFVYDTWPAKDTSVECQDGSNDPDAAWVAVIDGDPVVKSATFGEGDKIVTWYSDDESQVELTSQQKNNWTAP